MTEESNLNNKPRYVMGMKGSPCNVLVGISDSYKRYERVIICIKEQDKIYKVISVSASKKDGSINAFFPYCKEKLAYVYKHIHKYRAGRQKISKKRITKEFTVDKTAKLSIHKSGFVQLSGKGILSGIDEETGKPRGIGIFSLPLDNPVSSGPTFVFQCWGISNGFDLLDEEQSKDTQYIILDKDRGDFTERIFIKGKKTNSYGLEFFIFPKEAKQGVYEYRREPFIDHMIPNYLFNPGATFTHPVLDLKYFGGVICVFPFLFHCNFDEKSETGYSVGSPGGSGSLYDKSGVKQIFRLICPRDIINEDTIKNLSKLEFED